MTYELPQSKSRLIMNGFFYVTCILSISLASHGPDTIRCNGNIEVKHIQCKNISTGDGYEYPWDVVCDDVIEVYNDSQTLLARHHNSKLPQQTLCQNLTVKCFHETDGKMRDFCVKFVIDSSLSDQGNAKQQLNNTSKQTGQTESMKNKTLSKDPKTPPGLPSGAIGGIVLAVVLPVAVLALVLGCCLLNNNQRQAQNLGLELPELNRPNDDDQPTPGNGVTSEDGALPGQTAAQSEGQPLLSGTNGVTSEDGALPGQTAAQSEGQSLLRETNGVTSEDGALPGQTAAQSEGQPLLSGTNGPVTGDGTGTLTNDGAPLDGPRRRVTSVGQRKCSVARGSGGAGRSITI